MKPYARCSTRLNRLRAAELQAYRLPSGFDRRVVGNVAHRRMRQVLESARDHSKSLIEFAVAAQAKRFGWTDLADRLKAALAKSSRIGTSLHRARRTQAKG